MMDSERQAARRKDGVNHIYPLLTSLPLRSKPEEYQDIQYYYRQPLMTSTPFLKPCRVKGLVLCFVEVFSEACCLSESFMQAHGTPKSLFRWLFAPQFCYPVLLCNLRI